jgi:hypothetical protein
MLIIVETRWTHNITITLTDCWHAPLCCKHDQYLMEPALKGKSFTPSEYEHINCVRMHLQVATLSDILMVTAKLSIRTSWLANDQLTANLLAPGLVNHQ